MRDWDDKGEEDVEEKEDEGVGEDVGEGEKVEKVETGEEADGREKEVVTNLNAKTNRPFFIIRSKK